MSKGFLPCRRQRSDPGVHGGGAGRVVPGDGRHAAAGRGDRQGESVRPGRDVLGRCRRPQRIAQRRPDFRRAHAARRTAERGRDRAAAARPAVAREGHQGLRAEHSGDPHRRTGHQELVSVHAAGNRHHRVVSMGTANRDQASLAAGTGRRDQRSADRQAADHGRDRPQQGLGAGGFSAGNREHAVRRLRTAAGLDNLCADQPVLGRDGARVALPDRSVGVVAALRPFRQRRAGTAQQRRHAQADSRAAGDQSSGSVAVGDDIVRPAARCRDW